MKNQYLKKRTLKELLREAHVELNQISCCSFSKEAKAVLKRIIRKHILQLVSDSIKLSQREHLEGVSERHVREASKLVLSSKSYGFLGTIGGVLLGASLSALLTMVSTGPFSTTATLVCTCFSVVGTSMIAFQIARDF